jgi:hypothetical protein
MLLCQLRKQRHRLDRMRKPMIVRQAVHDRQSNRRSHTSPQVDFKKNSMGGVSQTFGGSR